MYRYLEMRIEEKGVTISVYVEFLSTIDSQYRSHPLKRTARRRGYDHRAQLLAYAHELRHANSTYPQCTSDNSKQKQKKSRWTRIGLPFSRLFRPKNKERRYEQMGREESCDAEESCYQRGSKGKKMSGANAKGTSSFCVCVTL
ncbi:PREDICTED: uncharacterized protein LOC109228181 isoform X2 [Nicotiana attenuata]|uniref:uncharacterized protein LOC109228181 isoform X2 n=1 Tax=Nicotiana attenuata TaxID=49451 RepID=UPI000905556B|nr:PREDICTED: uncharacterized protein LOC109228181 isoform X2 [Nicotiana attenuata]